MREMKDSSVEWIGEIPAHWSPIRFRFVAKITTGNQDTQNANPDGEYPFYVRSPIVERCNNYTFDGKGILMAGDGAGAGRVFHLVDGKYAVHQRVYRFYDFKYMDPVLLKYYLENLFATVMDYGSAKTTVPSVRLPMIQDFVVCVPPKKEQDNIVAVLNEKCAQVGSLISNVQAQIEKLKAYKQRLITEVVTKGLDPTVPMKDSGLEWIGEIPAHWGVTRIKNMFELWNERNDEADLTKVNLISLYTDLGVVQHSDLTATTGNRAVTAEGYKIVREHDIVVNIILCWMGAVGMSQYDGVTSPAYDIYRPLKDTNSEYYHYLFRTNRFNGECYRYGRGIMMMRWRTYSTEFRAINIPCPPAEEQKKIVTHLNEKCNKIDQLIAIKQAKIEKLEQYKRSLIYEYVTGKREVV